MTASPLDDLASLFSAQCRAEHHVIKTRVFPIAPVVSLNIACALAIGHADQFFDRTRSEPGNRTRHQRTAFVPGLWP
jgi:hypothetical protein